MPLRRSMSDPKTAGQTIIRAVDGVVLWREGDYYTDGRRCIPVVVVGLKTVVGVPTCEHGKTTRERERGHGIERCSSCDHLEGRHNNVDVGNGDAPTSGNCLDCQESGGACKALTLNTEKDTDWP